MHGPYPLSKLQATVDLRCIGVYVLSRDGRHAHYAGRSDSDLRSRIRKSTDEDSYTHFWYSYETSPMNAYRTECELWHRYQPPDNINHPAVPAGTNWRCPVRGCPWS